MKNIKIFIEINPLVTSSALANRWLHLIYGLQRFGYKFTLLVYGPRSEKQYETNIDKSIRVIYLNSLSITSKNKIRIYYYILQHLVRKKLIKKALEYINQSDLVWTDNHTISHQLAVFIKKKKLHNLVVCEISEYFDIYKNQNMNYIQYQLLKYRENYFEKKAVHFYDGIMVMTQSLKSYIINLGKNESNVIHVPMTVDLEKFTTKSPQPSVFEQPYIAYVGTISNSKDGIDILIQSFYKLISHYSELKLYIVGEKNVDFESCQALVNSLGLERKIVFTGSFDRRMIPSIIQNAKLLVLPRPDSKQAVGGFPTKLGEYLATGIPVCVTNVGEIPMYIKNRHNAYVATAGSIESFYQSMLEVLEDYETALEIAKKGKETAEISFNKDLQAKIIDHFLTNLLHDSNS